jgi:hypothetical protein
MRPEEGNRSAAGAVPDEALGTLCQADGSGVRSGFAVSDSPADACPPVDGRVRSDTEVMVLG